MGNIITKAALSRHAGLSRMAITKAAAGPLADAVVDGKIDAAHPLVVEWLASHGVHTQPEPAPPSAKKKSKPKKKRAPAKKKKSKPKAAKKNTRVEPEPETEQPVTPRVNVPTTIGGHDIQELEHLTVREVVMRYGSVDGFKRFVDSLKQIADYKFRELKIKQQRGDLISRDTVAGAVFPLIDVAFQRLVSDVPASITQQIVARVESGGDDTAADVEKLIRDANSRVLKNAKESVTKLEILKDANRTPSA